MDKLISFTDYLGRKISMHFTELEDGSYTTTMSKEFMELYECGAVSFESYKIEDIEKLELIQEAHKVLDNIDLALDQPWFKEEIKMKDDNEGF